MSGFPIPALNSNQANELNDLLGWSYDPTSAGLKANITPNAAPFWLGIS